MRCVAATVVFKPGGMSTDIKRVRALPVASFVVAALLAFLAAMVAAAEEAYIRWDDRTPLGLTSFGAASLVAAALALVPGSRPTLQVRCSSCRPSSPSMSPRFEVAVILVLAGGVLASGLLVRGLGAAAAGTRKRDQ
jgi:hypothetical protein